ncbi:GlxA family transcriptional regulator [Psychrobacter sp. UBA2514]|jgi:transcriptional regulator GlxA family with amidase domain|uniref:GlxA family transcriptional regulator n=1 Tax=Psychrobacter sp. UBA2514 TaxID=1947346 RepID=UPI00258068DD|nr:helix-turn-helix domain-containing protein [Psychrobacter sp. UBA2514]|tara:strand:+ start:8437 stop:9447 length:1011 start_codon:yes stop_codon:yes gene_type:complete
MPYFKPFNVIVLGFDGVLGSVLAGALDLFSFTGVSWQRFSNEAVEPRFKVQIASLGGGDIRCSNRLMMRAHCDIQDVTECDLLLVPTIGDSIDKVLKQNNELLPHLVRLANTKADIASNCSGAFFLAEAGLLDHKVATTHWGYANKFKADFPLVDLQENQFVTHASDELGSIFCAAGGSAFYDLGLLLIERYCGREISTQVAKTQIIDSKRGNQNSYTNVTLHKPHSDQLVKQVQEFIEQNFRQPIQVSSLAAMANITPRTLNRRFQASVAMRPVEYIQAVRIEQAKRLLELGDVSIKSLADQVGYDDISSFTRLFKRATELTPKEYQDKFSRLAI